MKVSFKPGDVAVLHCDRHLPIEVCDHIQKAWKSIVGDVPLFINDKGMRLEVLSFEDDKVDEIMEEVECSIQAGPRRSDHRFKL